MLTSINELSAIHSVCRLRVLTCNILPVIMYILKHFYEIFLSKHLHSNRIAKYNYNTCLKSQKLPVYVHMVHNDTYWVIQMSSIKLLSIFSRPWITDSQDNCRFLCSTK